MISQGFPEITDMTENLVSVMAKQIALDIDKEIVEKMKSSDVKHTKPIISKPSFINPAVKYGSNLVQESYLQKVLPIKSPKEMLDEDEVINKPPPRKLTGTFTLDTNNSMIPKGNANRK